jgi:hypothetical protein
MAPIIVRAEGVAEDRATVPTLEEFKQRLRAVAWKTSSTIGDRRLPNGGHETAMHGRRILGPMPILFLRREERRSFLSDWTAFMDGSGAKRGDVFLLSKLMIPRCAL